jgi:hypothetical protein
VHAARSYIGSQSWFLANIVPPDSEALKRFVALLWAYVQNNKALKADSNRHYSPWARKTLIQEPAKGGLNAQDFTSQLSAFHAKWIFKLLDPRHVASWKALRFHFLRSAIPGLGDSIFLLDPSCISCIQSYLPERWTAYLRAWFCSGLQVASPPIDYECILNEPIWFNRFLYLQTDPKMDAPLISNVKIN